MNNSWAAQKGSITLPMDSNYTEVGVFTPISVYGDFRVYTATDCEVILAFEAAFYHSGYVPCPRNWMLIV